MILLQLLLGLPVLGILIFIHELGHFLAARACGIEVEVFSLGMGPRIWGFRRRDTDYRLSAIPLGGYCRMKGEKDLSNALESKLTKIDPSPGSYYAASPLRRIAVVLAGPLANFLLALVIMTGLNLAGYEYQSLPSRLVLYSSVDARKDYPADKGGLKTGDTVQAINGKRVRNYREIYSLVGQNALQNLEFDVLRDGSHVKLRIVPELQKDTGAGKIGVVPWQEPVLHVPPEGKLPAGLEPGDRFLSLNGKAVRNTVDLETLAASEAVPHVYRIQRGGRQLEITLTPDKTASGNKFPVLPFKLENYRSPDYNLLTAMGQGLGDCLDTLALSVRSISYLFSGLNPQNAVSGPLRISQMVGESTVASFQAGFSIGVHSVLEFISLISIALFFGNLLPIPALDGGQFVLFLWELVTRRSLSPRVLQNYQLVGVVLVLGLTVFAFYGDIVYFLGKAIH